MKKILILLIACMCLISCGCFDSKTNYRVYTGRVIVYQRHTICPDKVIIRLDNGKLIGADTGVTYTCEGDDSNNDIFMYHYYHNKSHIRLVFGYKVGKFMLDSINEIK